MRFVYSLVRFVPDPARGEFVNVAAIVGSEASSEWQVRQVENPLRARRLDEGALLLDAVWSFLDRVGAAIDKHELATESLFGADPSLDETWLEQLYLDHQNLVQLSPPTPMVADSANDAMDRVFDLLVVDPASRRFSFEKKHAALGALRAAYAAESVRKGTDLRERVNLRTEHHEGRFDFAVTNGRVLQLTQTWSFQIPDQEGLAEQVKAWGWTVQDARKGGGILSSESTGDIAVPEDVDVQVVYVPPRPDQPASALADAENVFEALGVSAVAPSEASLVASRARELLDAAGVNRLSSGRSGLGS